MTRAARLLLLLALWPAPGEAQSPKERPGLFRALCGPCHEGAGALARESLDVVDGVLTGRATGAPLRDFLPGHVRGLGAEDTLAIEGALLRIAEGRGRFQQRCGICHRSAEALARHRLILDEGELRGRYSGRDIDAFLASHGTRSSDEAVFFFEVLRRWAPSAG